VVTETFPLRDFDRIIANGGFTLHVTQSGTESISVTTDDNILPHLLIEVVERTLYLKPKPDMNTDPT